ncbi:MAG: formylmethanofuran dehydrogenase subunit E family protein [Candidatus Omnitrophica bacterium]|nr:formylmethanofuran dehydrogenase subunit E family protein [Candidatus Omnitrophota bacterium]
MKRVSLKEAIKFHGHLGPYLVLGILAGELGLEKLKAKKYFGLDVSVWGADHKPRSCLIDGLQLSTGSTYGKGNIKKLQGNRIKIVFNNNDCGKITLTLKDELINNLNALKRHADSEALARKLFKAAASGLFNLKTNT